MVEVAARSVVRPQRSDADAWVGCVRLSPDGKSLAYAQVDVDVAGVLVERDDKAEQVLLCEAGMLPENITWSPDGTKVAVQMGEDETRRCKRVVSWVSVEEAAAAHDVMSSAHAWHPDSSRMAVFSAENQTVQLFGGESVELIGKGRDSGEPQFPPQLSWTRDGKRVALAVRSTFDDALSVWVFEQHEESGAFSGSFVTEVPGSLAYARPFWSPKGLSLGVLISHPERARSGIVVFRGGSGDGEIVYESDLVDPPVTPVWSKKGIAFMQTVQAEGLPQRLAWLDLEKRAVTPLSEPDEAFGTPRLLKKRTIVVDGDDAAYLFELS